MIKYIAIAGTIILVMNACSEDFLDTTPTSAFTEASLCKECGGTGNHTLHVLFGYCLLLSTSLLLHFLICPSICSLSGMWVQTMRRKGGEPGTLPGLLSMQAVGLLCNFVYQTYQLLPYRQM